jgi:hypothetical protein
MAGKLTQQLQLWRHNNPLQHAEYAADHLLQVILLPWFALLAFKEMSCSSEPWLLRFTLLAYKKCLQSTTNKVCPDDISAVSPACDIQPALCP